jgi:hypothetical protein
MILPDSYYLGNKGIFLNPPKDYADTAHDRF